MACINLEQVPISVTVSVPAWSYPSTEPPTSLALSFDIPDNVVVLPTSSVVMTANTGDPTSAIGTAYPISPEVGLPGPSGTFDTTVSGVSSEGWSGTEAAFDVTFTLYGLQVAAS
jgi:hypothetical protein